MNYPYISRPTCGRDSALYKVVENEVEELNIKDGSMMIVGMFFDDTEEKHWTLHTTKLESHNITIKEFSSPINMKKNYSDTFAIFSVD